MKRTTFLGGHPPIYIRSRESTLESVLSFPIVLAMSLILAVGLAALMYCWLIITVIRLLLSSLMETKWARKLFGATSRTTT